MRVFEISEARWIGIEYENLKTYPEYESNGLRLIDSLRSLWARDAAPSA